MLAVNNMKLKGILFSLSYVLFTSCEKSSSEDVLWWHNADIVELDASNYELNIADTSAIGDFVKFSFSRTRFPVCRNGKRSL